VQCCRYLTFLNGFVITEQRILIWAEYLNICSFNAMFAWDCVLCCFRSTECRAVVNRCWVMLPPACVIFKRTPFPAESVNHLHSSLAFSSQSLRQDNSQTKHIITHTHTHTNFKQTVSSSLTNYNSHNEQTTLNKPWFLIVLLLMVPACINLASKMPGHFN